MADRLKGITVEIAGDTGGLNKALKNVNQESRSLQSELSDVERLLKFNPDNVELIAQRQQLLNRQIETTSSKLNQLRQVEHQVQQQFERGDIGADQFRAFQREIIATEGRLQHFQNQAQETGHRAESSFKGMGAGIANGIAGAVAGAGIGTVISKSLENAALDTKIKLAFDVDESAIPKIKGIIGTIEAYGVDGETALEGVRKQFALNGDAADSTNEKIVQYAAAISKSFTDIDFNELIQESNEFAEAIGVSQEEALGMTNTLLKSGFPPDQLDIMTEYGSQLKRAGYNASEIQGIFAAGVETKSWNIDVLLDGVKEGRIKLAEFGGGVNDATKKLIEGTNISAKELETWGAAVAEGGDAGKVAFAEVATQLGKVDNDVQRNQIGVALFGTLWEEQGSKITDALGGASTKAGDFKKNQDGINQSVQALNEDPQVRLNIAISNMNTALIPLMTMVAEFVAKVADWAAKNPILTATIVAVGVGFGILMAAAIALTPAILALTGANWAMVASIAAIALPILAAIAVIGSLIAIGVLLYKNWGTIKTKARQDFNDLLVVIKGVMNRISEKWNEGIQDIKDGWAKVTKFFKGVDLKDIGAKIIGGLIKGMSNMYEKVKTKAREIAATVKEAIKDKLSITSPSKVTQVLGEETGAGFVKGLESQIKVAQETASRLAKITTTAIVNPPKLNELGRYEDAVTKYFEAIREDGDWLNDWSGSIPKQFQKNLLAMGQEMQNLEGGTIAQRNAAVQKALTVNLHSPKALDIREAQLVWNRTIRQLSLEW